MRGLVGRLLDWRRMPAPPRPENDAAYSFVEPEIRGVWAKGARSHLVGSISGAVAHWSDAMKLQLILAKRAGIAQDFRYFGPIWTCAIGHIAHMTTYAQARELGLIDKVRFVIGANTAVANRAYLDYLCTYFDIITDDQEVANLDIRYRSELPAVLKLSHEWVFLVDEIGRAHV